MQNTLEEALNSVLGGCLGLTEPCQCNALANCEWCGGAGWLTPKVKELKIKMQRSEDAEAELSDIFMKLN